MNYLETLNFGNKILKTSNIKSYRLDSEIILSKVINKPREYLLTNLRNNIDQKNFNNFLGFLKRRKKNEPIAYIFGEKEFWKNSFLVNKHVLIPRPETELIIEEVLKLTEKNSSKRFLDVGTGSGCLALSLIKERPQSYFTAIDISKNAINIAKINAKMHHLENKIKFVNIDIDKFKDNKYDFIVSNPPYINEINLKRLDKNVVCYEPLQALRAGKDGLNTIKKLIFKSKKLLRKNGKLIFEIGEKQKYMITELLLKNRFYINKIRNDLKCYPRVIISTNLS
tara:strand:+ start:472 stop:1317 length:846 start_codon:yes stop_codon:yes gene_type:complete